jgi:hypothetical protein
VSQTPALPPTPTPPVVIKYAATYDLQALERHVRGDTEGLEAEEVAAGGLRAALQARSGARAGARWGGVALAFQRPCGC